MQMKILPQAISYWVSPPAFKPSPQIVVPAIPRSSIPRLLDTGQARLERDVDSAQGFFARREAKRALASHARAARALEQPTSDAIAPNDTTGIQNQAERQIARLTRRQKIALVAGVGGAVAATALFALYWTTYPDWAAIGAAKISVMHTSDVIQSNWQSLSPEQAVNAFQTSNDLEQRTIHLIDEADAQTAVAIGYKTYSLLPAALSALSFAYAGKVEAAKRGERRVLEGLHQIAPLVKNTVRRIPSPSLKPGNVIAAGMTKPAPPLKPPHPSLPAKGAVISKFTVILKPPAAPTSSQSGKAVVRKLPKND